MDTQLKDVFSGIQKLYNILPSLGLCTVLREHPLEAVLCSRDVSIYCCCCSSCPGVARFAAVSYIGQCHLKFRVAFTLFFLDIFKMSAGPNILLLRCFSVVSPRSRRLAPGRRCFCVIRSCPVGCFY